MQYNGSDSPDKIPSDDRGDDVQELFRYQHSYVTLIAVEMCREKINYEEILCEQHEDVLVKRLDEKFDAIQIKTRENAAPFSLFDHQIKKSIERFIRLENDFYGRFTKFIIVSNCGFNNETSILIESLNSLQKNSRSVQFRRTANRYVRQMVDKCGSSRRTVIDVLSRLKFQQGPQFADVDSKIIEAHLGNLPICKGLNLDNLRQILEQIIHLVYNASSRRISEPISDYISFIGNSEITKFNLEIEEKRITRTKIMDIIKKNVDSINAITRTKDSFLELVDVEVIDDKRDRFPQLEM
jgi:hypothetical protein